MKNPFKKNVKILMKDLENYDHLLWDMDVDLFWKNKSTECMNNHKFRLLLPHTHSFILFEHIIYYVWFIDGSYIIDDFISWTQKSFDIQVNQYLNNPDSPREVLYYVLKWYREECYKKYSDIKKYTWEPLELINAWNALIPMLKYLYSISDEFK